MRQRIRESLFLGLHLMALLALGCTSIPPHPRIDSLEPGFSGRQARAHMESLEGLYPRFPGSRGDTIARAYLAREFRRTGARVRTLIEGGRRHLVAEFRGDSDDVVLLVSAYSSLQSGTWIDDSGAALLLEFARVLGASRLPYKVGLALAETRPVELSASSELAGESRIWRPVLTPFAARERLSEAGRSLARGIEAEGVASRVRAVIVFDTSARAGLQVVRDLRSHPEFRRLFWESAAKMGFGAMFPTDGSWFSPDSLHLGFRERSMDRALALVQAEASLIDPLLFPATNKVLPGVFDSIGAVTVEALSMLMRRFEKVDAFSR